MLVPTGVWRALVAGGLVAACVVACPAAAPAAAHGPPTASAVGPESLAAAASPAAGDQPANRVIEGTVTSEDGTVIRSYRVELSPN